MKMPVHTKLELDAWLKERGFASNPFEYINAEYEKELPQYFIDHGNFDEILHETQPTLIFAGRGCGKTAQRQMLSAQCRPEEARSSYLAIRYTYEGFQRALDAAGGQIENINVSHHIQAILVAGIVAFHEEILRHADTREMLKAAGGQDRFEAYCQRYTPWLAAPGSLRPGSGDPLAGMTPIDRLKEFSGLLHQAGLDAGIVFIDCLDEFPETSQDSRRAVEFITPVLGTMALVEFPGLFFKFYLSSEYEDDIRARKWFRADRFKIFDIEWNQAFIEDLIGERLKHYSERKPPYRRLEELCQPELAGSIMDELASLSGNLPRPALVLAGMLLSQQARQNSPSEQVSLETWKKVKEKWNKRRLDFKLPQMDISTEDSPSSSIGDLSQVNESLKIDETTGNVWVNNKEIRSQISPKEYDLLVCLYRHQSNVCTKQMIAQEAWPGDEWTGVSDEAIAQSVKRLRSILSKVAPENAYIETIRSSSGRQGGYRLYADGQLKATEKK